MIILKMILKITPTKKTKKMHWQRICMDGATKYPFYIMPTVRAILSNGSIPKYAIKSIASWYGFMRKIQNGTLPNFSYKEPKWNDLLPLLEDGKQNEFATGKIPLPRRKEKNLLPLHHITFYQMRSRSVAS